MKTLTKIELEKWLEECKVPFKLIVTEVSEDTIVIQRINWKETNN